MDKIDRLLQNPFFLHNALLKAMPETCDPEIFELQMALLQVNYANIILKLQCLDLRRRNAILEFELEQQLAELAEGGENEG